MGSLFRSKNVHNFHRKWYYAGISRANVVYRDMNGDDGWRNRVFITCTSTSNNTLSYAKVFTQPLDRRNSRNDGHADPPIHRNQPPISRVDSFIHVVVFPFPFFSVCSTFFPSVEHTSGVREWMAAGHIKIKRTHQFSSDDIYFYDRFYICADYLSKQRIPLIAASSIQC